MVPKPGHSKQYCFDFDYYAKPLAIRVFSSFSFGYHSGAPRFSAITV